MRRALIFLIVLLPAIASNAQVIHVPADYAGTERRLASADPKIDQGALESPYDVQVINKVINVPGGPPGAFMVYPNPAGSMITVRFTVVNPGPVRLSIYDLSGREVMVLLDKPLMPGEYELPLQISVPRKGGYILRLASGHNRGDPDGTAANGAHEACSTAVAVRHHEYFPGHLCHRAAEHLSLCLLLPEVLRSEPIGIQ